jgi:hypothetical protein
MTPWEVLLLVVWVGCALGGYEIGKHKGLPGPGLILALLVGVIGIRTIARVPQIREAKVEAARRHYEIFAEAAGSGERRVPGSRNRASGPTNPTDLPTGNT